MNFIKLFVIIFLATVTVSAEEDSCKKQVSEVVSEWLPDGMEVDLVLKRIDFEKHSVYFVIAGMNSELANPGPQIPASKQYNVLVKKASDLPGAGQPSDCWMLDSALIQEVQ